MKILSLLLAERAVLEPMNCFLRDLMISAVLALAKVVLAPDDQRSSVTEQPEHHFFWQLHRL